MKNNIILFFLLLLSQGAFAFEVPHERKSYVVSKHLSLGAGFGAGGVVRGEQISGDPGFSFKVVGGHHFTPWLKGELFYQFTNFSLKSPDPILVGSKIDSRMSMNHEALRVLVVLPSHFIQPFLGVGLGGYNGISVDRKTALSFSMDVFVPLSAGVHVYFLKNKCSLDLEFNYNLLFGENQDAATLGLLGVSRISFDTYSSMATFNLHLF